MHVVQSLEFGGAEKVVVQLANRFCNEADVTVCMTKRSGELVHEIDKRVKIESLEMGEGNKPELITRLRELIETYAIDVLHCHDWGVYVETVMAAKKLNKKVILTAHGPYTEYPPGLGSRLKIIIRHYAERYCSRYTNKIVAVSGSIKHYIVNQIKINPDKVQVIHNGIAGYDIVKKVKADECRRFITVGRIAGVKNHPLMLAAFSKLTETNKDISLTIVGDGPEIENVKSFSKQHIKPGYVEFLGFRTDIENILQQHDAFLLSSKYEGISIAGLEAMSLALPIISTDVGGVSEMVSDRYNGILVNNLDEYAAALTEICNDKIFYKTLSENSRKKFKEQFYEKQMLDDYRELYKN